jgi:hypothetical protein
VARVKALRHAAKVWSRRLRSPPQIYHNCYFIIHLLDLFEEERFLSPGERCLRTHCQRRLASFISDRASWWKQRGKFRALRAGDANTRFFQTRASIRSRYNHIAKLTVDGQHHTSHESKVAVLSDYYSGILGTPATTS